MQHVLLIGNPARRGRRRKARRRSASPAQRAARARFAAMARARSKSGRRHRRRAHRVVHANPIFHRRARRHVRRIRRNPIGVGMFRGLSASLLGSAVGAGGAIANDIAFGFASMVLPATATSPVSQSGGLNPIYYAAKTISALGLGILGKAVVGRHAVGAMEGALTVTFHDAMKQFLVGTGLPVPLGSTRYNAGRIIPPMPAQHTLRRYVGPGGMSRAPLEAYIKPSAREAVRR